MTAPLPRVVRRLRPAVRVAVRRTVACAIAVVAFVASPPALAAGPAAEPIDDARKTVGIFDGNVWDEASLATYAQTLATRPFKFTEPLPATFAGLDYDSYRMIRFNPVRTIWRPEGLPMQMEVYHRGYLYPEDVKLYLVEPSDDVALPGQIVRELPFDRTFYEYRGKASGLPHDPEYPAAAGYAGFNVIGHLPSSEYMQEVFSFIGSSYFRGLSDRQIYGSSCRALAIDIGLNKDEEFPAFRAFWIEKPSEKAKSLTVHGLADSPAVIGLFTFEITPGKVTSAVVDARLHFRHLPTKVGLAPISSMWMWGQGQPAPENDPRPEVHDTDGLLVHADSAWMWRPITRQAFPSVSRINATRIQGFGLMQRQRDPKAYNDDEARYVDRPSIWIEPLAGWTPGGVELMEFPTKFEGMDNIAAWFNPHGFFPAGSADPMRPIALRYRVSFLSDTPPGHTLAKATKFDIDRSATEKAKNAEGGEFPQPPVRVTLEFEGDDLAGYAEDDLDARVEAIRARVSDISVERIGASQSSADDAKPPKRDDASTGKATDETNEKSAGEAAGKASSGSRSTVPSRVRVRFTAQPETPYNYELRATLFGTSRPAAASDDSADGSSDEADGERSEKAAADAGVTRLLTETWSYLCPPQP